MATAMELSNVIEEEKENEDVTNEEEAHKSHMGTDKGACQSGIPVSVTSRGFDRMAMAYDIDEHQYRTNHDERV